jgi:hypothetical protein
MATRVRTISVNLTAGTAQFFRDLDQASGKIKQFGKDAAEGNKEVASEARAMTAAMKIAEGDMLSNAKAADLLLEKYLGLGKAAQAIFPAVGAAAGIGVAIEAGKKLFDFYKDLRDAEEKASDVYAGIGKPLTLANDEQAIAIQRVENEIARLEGHHENTLQLALLEATKAADQLAESLDKDLKAANKTLEEIKPGFVERLFGANVGDAGRFLGTGAVDEYLGGKSGVGGFIARQRNLREETSDEDFPAAQAKLLEEGIRHYEQAIADAKSVKPSIAPFSGTDMQGTIERLEATRGLLSEELRHNYQDRIADYDQQTRDTLEARNAERQAARPFTKSTADQQAQIAALQKTLDAVGKPEAAQVMARAFGEAGREIQKVNDELSKMNKAPLTGPQEAVERQLAVTRVGLQAEQEWQTKFAQGTVSIADRIRSEELLTAAIGRGYDATRAANVETQLMQEYGAHYTDTEWLGRDGHAAQMEARRGQLGAAFDSEHGEQSGRAIYALTQQIELEHDLAAAQAQGAEAVRQATLAAKLRQLQATLSADAFQREAAAEIDLYNAQRQNAASAELAKIDEKIAATDRLTAATLRGAAAVRQATLENRVAEVARQYDEPTAAAIRQFGIVPEEASEHAKEIATAAAKTRLQTISDEIPKLLEAYKVSEDQVGVAIQLRDLEQQRLQTLAQQYIALGTARDGLRAFFTEMQEEAEQSSKMIADAMNSAVDQTSANLAKALTGQGKKGDWAKQFKQEGEELVQHSVKALIQTGLGKLGAAVGIAKPDGSSAALALWVRLAAPGSGESIGTLDRRIATTDTGAPAGLPLPGIAGGAIAPKQAAGGGWLGALEKLVGINPGAGGGDGGPDFGPGDMPNFGGGSTPSVSSSISFPQLAEGGGVEAGGSYWVGDGGEKELFTPATPGTVTPLSRLGAGGDITVNNNIDARGADLGASSRLMRASEQLHRTSVAQGVRAMIERQKRVPPNSR